MKTQSNQKFGIRFIALLLAAQLLLQMAPLAWSFLPAHTIPAHDTSSIAMQFAEDCDGTSC